MINMIEYGNILLREITQEDSPKILRFSLDIVHPMNMNVLDLEMHDILVIPMVDSYSAVNCM